MGAIYMVLTFMVMVPMSLLTSAIINSLSNELQMNDIDIQSGIQYSLVQGLFDEESCVDVDPAIEEVMVGDAMRDESLFNGGRVRYFILNMQPDRDNQEGAAYVLRGFTDTNQQASPALSLSSMLPMSREDCTSEYRPPVFSSYDVCRVDRRSMLSLSSPDWSWQWLAEGDRLDTRSDYIYCANGLLITSK